MLRAWLILVLWLAPISVEAKVGEFTGDDFLNQCTTANSDWTPHSHEEHDRAVYCVGYIDATITMIVLANGQSFCLPTGITPQDVIQATVAFMQDHPDRKEDLFASVMVAAVRIQWPCQSK